MRSEISAEQIRATVDKLAAFGTRNTLSDTESDTRGIGAARRWIKSQFDAIAATSGRRGDTAMQVAFESYMATPETVFPEAPSPLPHDIEIVNVTAVLPGALPELRGRRYYVVAHYDSRATDNFDATIDAPGANDDASGVAVVLELARIMARHEFDATLVFMAVAGEEQCLCGSRFHAQMTKSKNLDVRAVLSNDIVGDPSSPYGPPLTRNLRVYSEGLELARLPRDAASIRRKALENDSPSRDLARFVVDVAARNDVRMDPILEYRVDRVSRGGDHEPFNEIGVPAIRFTTVDEIFERQHEDVRIDEAGVQHGDLPEYVDPRFVANVAELNLVTLAELVDAPAAPKDAVFYAERKKDVRLAWSANTEPDLAGYEVVWRQTSAPDWQGCRDVGLTTHTVLSMNKDNVVFGVRAYDRSGLRGPASTLAAAPPPHP
jgi:Zn-dependent M28 family amino/carboxypeptidase